MGCRSRAVSANKSKRSSSWIMAAVVWSPRRINRVCSARSRCSCCILYLLAARIIKNKGMKTWHIPVDMIWNGYSSWSSGHSSQWESQCSCSEPNGSVESLLYIYIYIYISHRDKSEVQGGNKGSGGTSHGRVAAPTHPRNQTTVGQTSLPVHQKQPEDSNMIISINSSVYVFSFFLWWLRNDVHTIQKGGTAKHLDNSVSNRSP